ncbi:hypothetical protein GCM10022224_034490 [Nonomuraea antimicrobica]|uniref:Secreted protein n=2 Tax=Nonomuraea antimicrobica TaxID=561173 RepID=A0ABP7BRM0_9ACTN
MSVRKRAVLGAAVLAVNVSLPLAPAAAAVVTTEAMTAPAAVAGSSVGTARAGAEQWSKWYTVTVKTRLSTVKARCRSYVSVNTGSKIKLRAYIECNRRTDLNIIATGTRDGSPIRGRQRACIATSCEAVSWVNNRKGVQRWCATTWPITNSDWAQGYRNRPKACLNY